MLCVLDLLSVSAGMHLVHYSIFDETLCFEIVKLSLRILVKKRFLFYENNLKLIYNIKV